MEALLLLLSCFFHEIVSAQPKITSFSPASGPAGTTVTITGTGFSSTPANNIVFFGAVRATVTSASVTSLTVTAPSGASYQPLKVTSSGLSGYSGKPFIITFPGGNGITSSSFAPRVNFAGNPNGTISLAAKDIDNDGKADLTAPNFSVYKNASTPGNLVISAPFNFAGETGYTYLAVEDLDGDGKPDVVEPFAPSSNPTITFIKNTSSLGNLSFDTAISFVTDGGYDIAVSDFDGDGLPDIISTNNTTGNGIISILRNNSVGGILSFSPPSDLNTFGFVPRRIVTGDINNDTKPDLVIAGGTGSAFVVYVNTSTPGNISFNASSPFLTTNPIRSVAIADFDGDNKPDVVASSSNSSTAGTISIFRNTGSGNTVSFATKVDFTTGDIGANGLTIGDLDGDARPDIVVDHSKTTNNTIISVFRNTSTSGAIYLDPKVDLTVPSSLQFSVAVNDVDGDGKSDISVAGYYPSTAISIFRNIIGTALPISLSSFNARWNGNDGSISWTTETEQNVKKFIIEQSIDGLNFTPAGTVAASGNSNTVQRYVFTDVNRKTLAAPLVYYRLRIINTDGTFAYSNTTVLNTDDNSNVVINAAPNPFRSHITLNIASGKKVNATVIVTDANGHIVLRQNAVLERGHNNIGLDGSTLSKGIYNVQIISSEIITSFKIIKQ